MSASTPELLEDLASLVRCESPSSDVHALAHCAELVGALGERLLGSPPARVDVDGVPQLAWAATDAPRASGGCVSGIFRAASSRHSPANASSTAKIERQPATRIR